MGNTPPTIDPADREKAEHLVDEVMDAQRSHLESASKILDKVLKLHENGASFYEKLILFDVGTIALSLTLLGQIAAHAPGGHVPGHPFHWFLCPAWFLLLVSIQGCAQRIAGFHNTNTLLARQMSNLFSDNHAAHLKVLLTRLNAVVGRMPLDQEKTQTLSTLFSNASEVLGKATKEESDKVNELFQKAVNTDRLTAVAARISIIATTVALVLICIFTIESISNI